VEELSEQEWRDLHVSFVAQVVYNLDRRMVQKCWKSRGIALNLDGSDKDSFRPGIKGLTTAFPAPLPEIDQVQVDQDHSIECKTAQPDYDVLDAQGRPEDRKAMEAGEAPSDVAGKRKRRKDRVRNDDDDSKKKRRKGCDDDDDNNHDDNDDNDDDDDEDPGKVWEVEGEELYEVAAILNKRMVKGKVQYQIKWKGHEETTWEAVSALAEAPDILNKFRRDARAQNQRVLREEENDPTD
jgi:hypothetical protein